MFYLDVRFLGRVVALRWDGLWRERQLGFFWTNHDAEDKEYHIGKAVIYVHRPVEGDSRFELECGRFCMRF